MCDLTLIMVNVCRSTGQVLIFLLHSKMHSRQKQCSHDDGVAISCFLNGSKQIGHFSDCPSLLSDSNPAPDVDSFSPSLIFFIFFSSFAFDDGTSLSDSFILSQSDCHSEPVSLSSDEEN